MSNVLWVVAGNVSLKFAWPLYLLFSKPPPPNSAASGAQYYLGAPYYLDPSQMRVFLGGQTLLDSPFGSARAHYYLDPHNLKGAQDYLGEGVYR